MGTQDKKDETEQSVSEMKEDENKIIEAKDASNKPEQKDPEQDQNFA